MNAAVYETRLFYRQPARNWNEALPIGNSHLGAMVFGEPIHEHLALNEETIWDGYPRDQHNPNAAAALPEVRRLIFAGQNREAEELAMRDMLAVPSGIKSYQPLSDLFLDFDTTDAATEYRHELDLESAICTTTFRLGDSLQVTREVYASYPDKVLVVQIAATGGTMPPLTVRLLRGEFPDAHKVDGARNEPWRANQKVTVTAEEGMLRMDGQVVADPEDDSRGVQFAARVQAVADGGTVTAMDAALRIENAYAITLYLTAATNYRGNAPQEECTAMLAHAINRGEPTIRSAHLADYEALFERCRLELVGDDSLRDLPTDERLKCVRDGAMDNGLCALYFHYGRYLLIASSRPGSLPANLQGVWNPYFNAPWQSDYHTNINIQMNYWHAETTNLSECHTPLFDFVDTWIAPGQETARRYYNARGAVLHHTTDIWGFTLPTDFIGSFWVVGLAWTVAHAWAHYEFSQDTAFLQNRAYPLLKEAARFLADFLVESPDGQYLVTCPSYSPENTFRKPDGTTAAFDYGVTMDRMILRELFENTVAAAKILDTDMDFRAELDEKLRRLPPLQISPRDGRLQEWRLDYDEPEPGHRHISHVYGLYPGAQITKTATPDLVQAIRKSVDYRLAHGGGHTGWSRAWIINVFARFGEGDIAHDNFLALLRKSTLTNLLDDHPPFQIDGNFGGTAGIAEMLLQSHEGQIALLPALPSAWHTGSVIGLRARGGYTVSIAWEQRKLTTATVTPDNHSTYLVRLPDGATQEVNGVWHHA